MKQYLETNVYEAAVSRCGDIFREFDRVYVSFSAGKDSGVLVNLALDSARRAGKLPLHVLFVDLEAQYKHTIDYATKVLSNPDIVPYWVCLPLHLRNAVSQIQPHWLCWDKSKTTAWVRDLPVNCISDPEFFPFFRVGMEFEEFVPEFADWFSEGQKTACLVGIRSDESLNRFRTIKSTNKEPYLDWQWTTKISDSVWNAYPIYDWRTEDIWTANGKFGWSYNKIYDLMQMAGLTLSQMRLCQPYGDDQRKGLYLFKILEPETWQKVVSRVEGANFGNKYSKTQSHVMGNLKINLPEGHTYKSYAKFLLSTMPPYLSTHYRTKILVFLKWWKKHRHNQDKVPVATLKTHGLCPNWRGIPDCVDPKLESGSFVIDGVRVRLPSWRRIVKTLVKNDYWCKGLSFSQTKREMERQMELMAKS